jgi:hypothetical protein
VTLPEPLSAMTPLGWILWRSGESDEATIGFEIACLAWH